MAEILSAETKMERVILLNADYKFISEISWRRALKLIHKGNAEVLKYSNRVVRTATHEFILPRVMKLVNFIKGIYNKVVKFSRTCVFVRDQYTCQYCGKNGRVQIEHIVPKSRGGKLSFDNCVAACQKCNSKKAQRTPEEAGMQLLRKPYTPTVMDFLVLFMRSNKIDRELKSLNLL